MYECIRMEGSIAVGYQASSHVVKISLLACFVSFRKKKEKLHLASLFNCIPSEFEAVL